MLALLGVLVAPASGDAPAGATLGATADVPPKVVGNMLVVGTLEGEVRIVPVYHATTRVELPGAVVWVDPWSDGDLDDGPRADIVLLSHPHPDHLDAPAIARVSKPGTVIVAPRSVQQALEGIDVEHVLDNYEVVTIGTLTIEAVPAYNISRGPATGALYHEEGVGNGYLLHFGGRTVYFAGDTECTVEMRSLKGIDVAFLPMNLPYTMSVGEAASCANAFRPHVVVPYHYLGSDTSGLRPRVTATGVRVVRLGFYRHRAPRGRARSAAAISDARRAR